MTFCRKLFYDLLLFLWGVWPWLIVIAATPAPRLAAGDRLPVSKDVAADTSLQTQDRAIILVTTIVRPPHLVTNQFRVFIAHPHPEQLSGYRIHMGRASGIDETNWFVATNRPLITLVRMSNEHDYLRAAAISDVGIESAGLSREWRYPDPNYEIIAGNGPITNLQHTFDFRTWSEADNFIPEFSDSNTLCFPLDLSRSEFFRAVGNSNLLLTIRRE